MQIGLGVTERRIACVRGPRGVDTDALAIAGPTLDDGAWPQAQIEGRVGLVRVARSRCALRMER